MAVYQGKSIGCFCNFGQNFAQKEDRLEFFISIGYTDR